MYYIQYKGKYDNLYYIAVFILVFRYILGSSMISTEGLSVLTYIGWILFFSRIIFIVRRPKYYFMLGLLLLLSFYAYKQTDSLLILSFVLTVFSAQGINIESALKAIRNAIILGVIFVFFMGFMHGFHGVIGILCKITAGGGEIVRTKISNYRRLVVHSFRRQRTKQ